MLVTDYKEKPALIFERVVMIAESNVEFVYVLQMMCDGEQEIIDIFRHKTDAVDRARDIAEYADLPEDENSGGNSWSNDFGTCIWIERKELL